MLHPQKLGVRDLVRFFFPARKLHLSYVNISSIIPVTWANFSSLILLWWIPLGHFYPNRENVERTQGEMEIECMKNTIYISIFYNGIVLLFFFLLLYFFGPSCWLLTCGFVGGGEGRGERANTTLYYVETFDGLYLCTSTASNLKLKF